MQCAKRCLTWVKEGAAMTDSQMNKTAVNDRILLPAREGKDKVN